MEKIDEFLHPDTWSMLLVDEAKQELYFELAIGKNAHTLKDVRIKMGQGIAGWVAAQPAIRNCSRRQPRYAVLFTGRGMRRPARWRRTPSWPYRCDSANIVWE